MMVLSGSDTGADRVTIIGAVAVLAGGALHARLALDRYGTTNLVRLFFVNAILSAVVATWLVVDRRPFASLAGVAISAGSLIALGASRIGSGVVGFRGTGLDPIPDVPLTVLFEFVALLALVYVAVSRRAELIDNRKQRARPRRAPAKRKPPNKRKTSTAKSVEPRAGAVAARGRTKAKRK